MSTSHPSLTAFPARYEDHVLRTILPGCSVAAQMLAARERHQAALAEAARMLLAHEAGISSAGIGPLLASVRRLTGAALVWSGKRLRGQPSGFPAASPTSSA
jgi:hypothetical protein